MTSSTRQTDRNPLDISVLVGLIGSLTIGLQTHAMAQDLPQVGPTLGAATNMSQGVDPQMISMGRKLGVVDFRDGLRWQRIEKQLGKFVFQDNRSVFPTAISATGAHSSVVLNWGNPLYDNGETPHSAEGIAAFGAFAGAVVAQFPSIHSLEIGNEFNGTNFVRGPLRQMTPSERARAYIPLLQAASMAARAVRPSIKISGAATHSMAAGYIWEVLEAGGAEAMDALAIHPYTTKAEQMVRQTAVLRRHPLAAGLPIEVTEFGTKNIDDAAGHFMRNYCQFALSGVSRAIWYPLNERGDRLVPLATPEGGITPAGKAYRFIAERMEGRPVTNAAFDSFSYGCLFGTDSLVLWGEPRDVTSGPKVKVYDAAGLEVSAPFALTPTDPLIFIGPPEQVQIGQTDLIADSFHQFGYPLENEAQAAGDSFARFARRGSQEIPLVTLPGQEKQGRPWFPYRGRPNNGGLRLTADSLLPDANTSIVHQYIAPADMTVDVSANFDATALSEDGVTATLLLNNTVLEHQPGAHKLRLEHSSLKLAEGDRLEIVLGPNQNPKGDITGYRITLTQSLTKKRPKP